MHRQKKIQENMLYCVYKPREIQNCHRITFVTGNGCTDIQTELRYLRFTHMLKKKFKKIIFHYHNIYF